MSMHPLDYRLNTEHQCKLVLRDPSGPLERGGIEEQRNLFPHRLPEGDLDFMIVQSRDERETPPSLVW